MCQPRPAVIILAPTDSRSGGLSPAIIYPRFGRLVRAPPPILTDRFNGAH